MHGMKREILSRVWFLPVMVILLLDMGMSAFGSDVSKLPASYKSVEELYAALAKLPEAQRQEAIIAGARKEGKVVRYGAGEEKQFNALAKDFEQRYPGIKVEYLRSLPDEVVSKMLTEARADRWYWDLGSIGGGYSELQKANAIAKHHGLVTRGDYPKSFLGADWYGYEMMPLVIAYNKNMVKEAEAPKSYKELLDPKWKGKVSIDTGPDVLVACMIKAWGKEKAAEWLERFVNGNQALIRKGKTAQTQLLIAGEFPVASEIFAYRAELEIQSQGAPIDWVIPSDLAATETPGNGIARRAPHPFAALLFSQYMNSKEGQGTYAQFGRIGSLPDVKLRFPRLGKFSSRPTVDHLTLVTVEDYKLFEQSNELIEKYIVPRIRGGS